MILLNFEPDLSLTALVAGTDKIGLTRLNTLDNNNFWDMFKDEKNLLYFFFLFYFILFYFHSNLFWSTKFVKLVTWVFNLNLSLLPKIKYLLKFMAKIIQCFQFNFVIVWRVSMYSFCYYLSRIQLITRAISE